MSARVACSPACISRMSASPSRPAFAARLSPALAARRSPVCAAVDGIIEIQSMEEYEQFISAEPGVAVIDYYTSWCGPCKMILPAVVEMAADIPEARFAKFNMESVVGAAALSKDKGVKALPTFHIFRNGVLADSMSGSNSKSLRKLITANVMAHAAVTNA